MKKKIFFLLTYFFLTFEANSIESKVFVKKKVNEHLITNIDIKNEVKFIIAVNPKLKEIQKNKLFEYAENSLVNEKIKISELSKYYNLKTSNKLPDEVVLNFANKLGINDLNEMKTYLNNNNVSYKLFIEKIYIEHLWNVLIYEKFKNKIKIDEKKIRKNLLEQKKYHGNKNIYFLHEIIFNVSNKNKLKLKSEEIINSINKIGFENTANLYSISESARFNGKLGWIEENQLSELIKAEIKKTKIGNYTTPIKIRDGYIILFVKDKKVEKEDFDIDKKTNKQIAYEKNKILNEFSRQYFKKVAINQIIE
tara:strand:- start:160 stop:1086 length:927 start_codon:yes stop_codon:yes gene_type:complete